MAFITFNEIIDILIMAFAIGYIFSGYFSRRHDYSDPIAYYEKHSQWDNIKQAAIIAGTGVVLHELAHKFVAMSFGATATLKAPYLMYAIVIAMRALNFPILFFVGGYVSHSPLAAFPSALVALAGPLTNFLIWAFIRFSVKNNILREYHDILIPMARINLFLAIFNMVPIPGFDGAHFFQSLIRAIF